ncbi:homoserine O-acetyltransferase/O-succinyltransferase, partial [Lecanoromycetidae sp. Uapishka_2]
MFGKASVLIYGLRSSTHSAHKLVLDALGVHSVAAVVGGSMGGMATLEWPLCTPSGYVKNIIPIATSADHCAWGISWAETQKQCIYADANFHDGNYDLHKQPAAGLAAARMIAMLTYRSCVSFDRKFGRKPPPPKKGSHKPQNSLDFAPVGGGNGKGVKQDPRCDAFRSAKRARLEATNGAKTPVHRTRSPIFSAQGYLNYQGEKFIKRFDANCYICLTNKMDTHDVTRGRLEHDNVPNDEDFRKVLQAVPPKSLVVGVDTDNLFQPEQQAKLASYMPDATLASLNSPDGHDGFLLAFEELNTLITERLRERCPWVYEGEPLLNKGELAVASAVKDSVFGEVESQW